MPKHETEENDDGTTTTRVEFDLESMVENPQSWEDACDIIITMLEGMVGACMAWATSAPTREQTMGYAYTAGLVTTARLALVDYKVANQMRLEAVAQMMQEAGPDMPKA